MSRRVAVYLSINSPNTLLNDYLCDLAANKDMPEITAMLLRIYRLHRETMARVEVAGLPLDDANSFAIIAQNDPPQH